MNISFVNRLDYEMFKGQLQARLDLPLSGVVKLFNYTGLTEEDFCTSIFMINLYVEYEPRTLATEVSRRKCKGLYFDPAEARTLCWTLLRALHFLHRQNMFQGLLNLQRVVVCSRRRFKLIDRLVTQ